MPREVPSRAVDLAKLKKERVRLAELRRCQTDLFYLATEVLDYKWNPNAGTGVFKGKGLTERLHKPIAKWFDDHRLAHFMLLLMARWHHKTTLVVAMIIQDILIDPNTYLFYFHAVDGLAHDVVKEVGNHLLHNKKLRALEPIGQYPQDYGEASKRGQWYNVLPRGNVKRWLKTEEFTVSRCRFVRFPTLLGKGAGSEVTGAHSAKAYCDDIIGKRAVEDSLVPKIGEWFRDTVLPVVDDLIVRAIATPWVDFGLIQDWLADPDWRTCVLPGSTKEDLEDIDWTQKHIALTPDYDLGNPIYGPTPKDERQIKKLRVLQRQMKGKFGPQIMCDPSPKADKPWGKVDESKLFIPYKPDPLQPRAINASGPGVIFVLSDPAPRFLGGQDPSKLKDREDDSDKDFWAIAVIKFRRRGMMMEKILLDGARSRNWSTDEGFDQVCRLMLRWRTNMAIHESYGGLNADYRQAMLDAARRNGVPWMDKDKDGKPIAFRTMYVKGAKSSRAVDLAADAENGGFYICDTCPQDFLYGPEGSIHEGFLPQIRGWKVAAGGKNGLRHDDEADIVARSQDPIFDDYAPVMEHVDPNWRDFLDMQEEYDMEHEPERTRYGII